MTDIADESVIAFVDGQLDSEARVAFEARLAREPRLSERVAAHRWMARQIAAAYGPPPERDVDDALVSRLGLGDGRVVALSEHRRAGHRGRFRAANIAAIAASLALGLVIGRGTPTPNSALIEEQAGRPIASGILAAGLSNQLTGEPGAVRIGLSFRTDQGICRTFRNDRGLSGIGCREGRYWRVPMMTAELAYAGSGAGTEYQLAGGQIPPAVMAQVDRWIRGEPLAPSEEVEMRKRGWRG